MPVDSDRRAMVQDHLKQAGVDALVCGLPAHVLMLSGYWPVIGTSLAITIREGPTVLLVPQDEKDLAEHGGADEIHTYQPASMDSLETPIEAQLPPLAALARKLGLTGKRIGYEHGGWFEAASYCAMHLYRRGLAEMLAEAFDRPQLVDVDEHLVRLRTRKTPQEIDRIRLACRIAQEAFEAGRRQLHPGMKETEAAEIFRAPLSINGVGREGIERADGLVSCMSGPNSARAAGAFARSQDRRLAERDLVLIHCNSYADGYWTDITRTYCLGEPDEKQQMLFAAVADARRAAWQELRSGARGAEVDRAARDVLEQRGLGKAFKHSSGHGIGFGGINHTARPRLHPQSTDALETGMVFNVEPAVYLEGYGGIRHCDMVAMTPKGAERLTPFPEQSERGRLH